MLLEEFVSSPIVEWTDARRDLNAFLESLRRVRGRGGFLG